MYSCPRSWVRWILALIFQVQYVNLGLADGTDPQSIFEKVCADGDKQIVRLARPIDIEFHDFSNTGGLIAPLLANGIASIRFNANLDLRFTPGAKAAGESNIIIFLLPRQQDDISSDSIGEITNTIDRLSASEGNHFDEQSYISNIKQMYEPEKTHITTTIMHGGEIKYIVLALKSPYLTTGQDKYLLTVIVSFLAFNGKSPNIKGTVFARPGADVLLFGPGLVELNYLRALYKSPERGNMLCPTK